MKCPFCSHTDTQVVETRLAEDGDLIRRRRQCAACEKRFTTYERPEVNFPAIVKKDGRRIEYERVKLRASMNLALRKRPVSTEQVDSAIERIEEKLLNLAQREIASNKIGELVMRELKSSTKWPMFDSPVFTVALKTLMTSNYWLTKSVNKFSCTKLPICSAI